MSAGLPVEQLTPGMAVDLEGIDAEDANAPIWLTEYAEVESVSTAASPSGGYLDHILSQYPDRAIIYTGNGAVPSVVPLDVVVPVGP
jgi:hypothetical protein